MSAGKYNITIEQGSTFQMSITYKDSTGAVVQMRTPASGYTVDMKIKESADGDLIDTFTGTYSGDIVTFPTDSIIRLYGDTVNPSTSDNKVLIVNANTTDAYNFDNAFYDIEVKTPQGSTYDVTRILEGKVKLKKSITR